MDDLDLCRATPSDVLNRQRVSGDIQGLRLSSSGTRNGDGKCDPAREPMHEAGTGLEVPGEVAAEKRDNVGDDLFKEGLNKSC